MLAGGVTGAGSGGLVGLPVIVGVDGLENEAMDEAEEDGIIGGGPGGHG